MNVGFAKHQSWWRNELYVFGDLEWILEGSYLGWIDSQTLVQA